MQYIRLSDYLLLPFYLIIIYGITLIIRAKFYPKNHPLHKYFIPALTVKLFGSIFIGLIYQYYFGGGDTFNFYYHSKLINSSFADSPDTWFRLITHTADQNNLKDSFYLSQMYWYDDVSSYTVSCLAAFIGIFCFTKYLIIALFFGFLSFTGTWLIFICFYKQYNHLKKHLFIVIFLIPSLIVWGSGIFKDTICLFGLGCIIFTTYNLLEKRNFRLFYVILFLVSSVLIFVIKSYILVSFLPFIIFKTFLVYKRKLAKNPSYKPIFYFTMVVIIGLSALSFNTLRGYLLSFSVENVLKSVVTQKDYLLRVSLEEGGSAYDLGEFEPTPAGLLKKTIPAINVALFRPYIWEAKTILTAFSAIEANILFLLTIYVVIKKNILKIISQIYHDPNLIMCLGFSLLFAFFVGISSFNFGSLSRYRIPCILFYAIFLVILYYDKNDKKVEKSLKKIS